MLEVILINWGHFLLGLLYRSDSLNINLVLCNVLRGWLLSYNLQRLLHIRETDKSEGIFGVRLLPFALQRNFLKTAEIILVLGLLLLFPKISKNVNFLKIQTLTGISLLSKIGLFLILKLRSLIDILLGEINALGGLLIQLRNLPKILLLLLISQ